MVSPNFAFHSIRVSQIDCIIKAESNKDRIHHFCSNAELEKKKVQADNCTTLEPIVVLPSPTQDWSENAFDDKSKESIADDASDTTSLKRRVVHKSEELFLKALQDRRAFDLRTINCFDRSVVLPVK